MKKVTLLLSSALLTMGGMNAAVLPEGMTTLLPDGVTATLDQAKNYYLMKNLCVAGSPTKGYKAFFAATDADHGEELWVTDGTQAGTKLVKDINPGVATSNISYLTRFNDKVVFSADNGENGFELWISDGTEAGTIMVKDIHELDSSNPIGFCQMDENHVVFFATDFESENFSESGAQKWLWITDGTESGTHLVKQVDAIWPGECIDDRRGPVVRVGRKVFFKGDVADKSGWTYGCELWVTDGTEAGTHMVKDINLEKNLGPDGTTQIGTLGAATASLVNYNNKGLFFKSWDEEHGNEPWFTDGTEEGTYMIYDTDPTVGANGIGVGGGVGFVGEIYKDLICFRAKDPNAGCEFGVTNCQKGNFRHFDIFNYEPTASNQSFADDGVVFDGYYMFCAATGFDATVDSHKGGELHMFDGEKVQMQYDFAPGIGCDWIKEPIVVGGSMYWWNEGSLDGTGAKNTKLIRLNKWNESPEVVSDIDASGDKVYCLRNLNGLLLFTSAVNNQLYCYNYRQPGYDASKNPDVMEPVFGEGAGGVEENLVAENAKVEVFPNPATESFRIKGVEAANVRVYDIAGRLVLDAETEGEAISVSGLAAGFYKVVAAGKTASLIVK